MTSINPSIPPPRPSSPTRASGQDSSGSAAPSRAADTPQTGREIMVARLFGGSAEAAQELFTPGKAPSTGRIYSFLTPSDRDLVASLYEFAAANGIEAREIDAVAFDLGCFRAHPNPSDSVGKSFDPVTGEPHEFAFKDPGDEAIAQRLLTSKAMQDTKIPTEFLRAELDPGLKGVHAADFSVLERLVYAYSASGSDGGRDPNAVLAPRPGERLAKLRAAGELPAPETMRASFEAPESDFERFSGRVARLTSYLDDGAKGLLGALYAQAEGKGEKALQRIDRFARDLAMLALTDALSPRNRLDVRG